MFELVSVIVLIQGMGLSCVDAAAKILDFRPALSLRDGRIADTYGCVLPFPAVVLQIVGKGLEIIFALDISQIGSQTIPRQCSGIVWLHALPELIHPSDLVFCFRVALRGGLDKPGHRLAIVSSHAGALLKNIADILLSLVA